MAPNLKLLFIGSIHQPTTISFIPDCTVASRPTGIKAPQRTRFVLSPRDVGLGAILASDITLTRYAVTTPRSKVLVIPIPKPPLGPGVFCFLFYFIYTYIITIIYFIYLLFV